MSPALAELLADPATAGVSVLLPGTVVGTIESSAVRDANELRVYQGTMPVVDDPMSVPTAVGWGGPGEWGSEYFGGSDPQFTTLLLVAGITVVIVPLVIFLALMTRLAGTVRNRRHATLRLLGGSVVQLRRIGLVETVLAAVLGLLLGGAGFVVARLAAPLLRIDGAGFFPADLKPGPLGLLAVVVGVPLLAVAVTVLGDRSVVAGPLTTVHSDGSPRRRLIWRVAVFGAGAALIAGSFSAVRLPLLVSLGALSAGIALLMISVAAMLPWAVERLLSGLQNGPPSWQLAVRRLQLDAGMPSRIVAGACVVLTGAIALQTLLVLSDRPGDQDRARPIPATSYYARAETPTLADVSDIADRFATVPGVTSVVGGVLISVQSPPTDPAFPEPGGMAVIADCSTLPATVACRDGEVFRQTRPQNLPGQAAAPAPGSVVALGDSGDVAWTVPATLTPIDMGVSSDSSIYWSDLIITPGSLTEEQRGAALAEGVLDLRVSSDAAPGSLVDALAIAAGRPATQLFVISPTGLDSGARGELKTTARTGLLIGGALTVVVAGLGLLVMSVEQLLQRRRRLTLAVASGVPRGVLARSLVMGAAVPMAIGVVMAAVVGNLLALAFLAVFGEPPAVDLTVTAVSAIAALGAVVVITAAVVPVLYRVTRITSVRTS